MCDNTCSKPVDPNDGHQDHGSTSGQELAKDDVDEIHTLCLGTAQTSRIKLQYNKDDPEKLTYFGAKLQTDAEGKHLLVEVEDCGRASQVYLMNHDVILEVNKTDVKNVSHGALLQSMQDLGTQVQFLIYRETTISRMKGLVYFRLGSLEGSNDMNGATCVYKVGNFQVVQTRDSDFASVTLPPTETVEPLRSYTLDSANDDELQQNKPRRNITFLNIVNCKFLPNNAHLCLYKYTEVDGPNLHTIVALASNPYGNGYQDGLRYRGRQLRVQEFPPYMKTKGTRITQYGFFFLMKLPNSSTVSISPVSDQNLYLTSDESNDARLEHKDSVVGFLSLAKESNDCSSKCIINADKECQICDCDD